MKNVFYLVATAFLALGCATATIPFEFAESTGVPGIAVTIDQVSGANRSVTTTSGPFGVTRTTTVGLSPTTLYFSVENKTGRTIVINWDKSSVNGENVLVTGRKYVDAGRPMQPLAVPPDYKVSKALISAEQVEFSTAGWSAGFWSGRPLVFVLCIEIDGHEMFSVQTITLK